MDKQWLYNGICPMREALNIIGGKWRTPIMFKLFDSALRYNELKRQLGGISNIMLTRCLRDLEKYGLVKRIQYSVTPLHVEYSLTIKGQQLTRSFFSIKEFGIQIIDEKNNEL